MQTMSLADAKTHLSRVVEDATATHLRTTITKNGRPAVVIMAVEEYESLQETIAVLSDPRTTAAIAEAEASDPAGDSSLEEIEAIVARRKSGS
jgi:antitoxin YefM